MADKERDETKAPEKPLTPKQERFIDEWLVDMCGTQAAKRAGYAEKSARSIASQLLAEERIQRVLVEKLAALSETAGLQAAAVLKETMRLAFSDVRDVCDFSSGSLSVRQSDELPDDAARAISEVTLTPGKWGDTLKVKLHPKQPALELLFKYLGLVVERGKVEHTGKNGGPIETQSTVQIYLPDNGRDKDV